MDDTATSLSLAAIREFGDGYSLAFNAALAERLPVAEELYADGPHLATSTIEVTLTPARICAFLSVRAA